MGVGVTLQVSPILSGENRPKRVVPTLGHWAGNPHLSDFTRFEFSCASGSHYCPNNAITLMGKSSSVRLRLGDGRRERNDFLSRALILALMGSLFGSTVGTES